jgi:hypothetical protein
MFFYFWSLYLEFLEFLEFLYTKMNCLQILEVKLYNVFFKFFFNPLSYIIKNNQIIIKNSTKLKLNL